MRCRNRLQADLQGITVPIMLPPRRPENDEGYLEIIEGPYRDGDYVQGGATPPISTLFGDADDVLMFTTRSRAEPFVGRFNSATLESQVAEIAYFAIPNGQTIDTTTNPVSRLYTLYRRVLLVDPGVKNLAGFNGVISGNPNWFDGNDISARLDYSVSGGPLMVPNSLGDLTKRECRFAHYPQNPTTVAAPFGFPFDLNPKYATGLSGTAYLSPMIGNTPNIRIGDDILMTNVLAFDVQVYDPGVPIFAANNIAPLPSDPGYYGASATGTGTTGGYVDLGYRAGLNTTSFSNRNWRSLLPGSLATFVPASLTALYPITPQAYWQLLSGQNVLNPTPTASLSNGAGNTIYVYDTWSFHYEGDGVQQNTSWGNDPTTMLPYRDLATNGLDDPSPPTPNSSAGAVDDAGECETQAPFAAQLRGIKITIRAYEPSSQQVRQVEVIQDFLPE